MNILNLENNSVTMFGDEFEEDEFVDTEDEEENYDEFNDFEDDE